MSNWEKISSDEMEIGLKIATLKKGELQIKYAKDIVEKNKEIERLNNIINKATKYIEEESWFSYKDDEEILDRIPIEKLKNILKGKDKE